jgi:DUF4097 and DUF4098 domain-containing protein YvlB
MQPSFWPRVALLVPLCCLACDDDDVTGVGNNDFSAQEPFMFGVERDNQTMFRLLAVSGSVEIVGVPGTSSLSISGERRVESNSLADAQENLARLEVQVSELETEIVVQTVQPADTGGQNFIVDYTISLPEDLVVNSASVNGSVRVDSVKSAVSVQHVNGPVSADAIEGDTGITVVNGGIDASITLLVGGTAQIDVANGDIALEIPQQSSAQFSAIVANGSITVSNLTLTNETVTPTSHTGTLGNGEGTIALRTVNGNIAASGR